MTKKLDVANLTFKPDLTLEEGDDNLIGVVAVPVKDRPDLNKIAPGSKKSEQGCYRCGEICWLDPRSQKVMEEYPSNARIYCVRCFFAAQNWNTNPGEKV